MDVHLVPFDVSDIVLVSQWFCELGPVVFYYEELYMSFNHGLEHATLKSLQ